MALLSFSDLIIGFTLLINSIAVLNFNILPKEQSSVMETIKQFISDVQALRVFIAIWNFIVIFLMILFFSS